jgi:hypothetical protein
MAGSRPSAPSKSERRVEDVRRGYHRHPNATRRRGLHVTGKLTLAGGTVTNSVVHGHRNVTAQDAIVTGAQLRLRRHRPRRGSASTAAAPSRRGRTASTAATTPSGYSEILGVVDGIGANYAGKATIEGCRIYHGWYEAWNDKTLGKPPHRHVRSTRTASPT